MRALNPSLVLGASCRQRLTTPLHNCEQRERFELKKALKADDWEELASGSATMRVTARLGMRAHRLSLAFRRDSTRVMSASIEQRPFYFPRDFLFVVFLCPSILLCAPQNLTPSLHFSNASFSKLNIRRLFSSKSEA